jgi:hypothetical protein
METLPSFALQLLKNDHLMSWDVKSGYRHFYLHPRMRDYFLFHYDGCFYRCVALPFGWGRSVLWFTKLMRPLVKYIRSELKYRLLPWIDDFLCAPTDGQRPASSRDCRKARERLTKVFDELGVVRHPEKGFWHGAQIVEHLGVVIDTREMRVFVTERKVQRMRKMAKELLLSAQRNRRWVPENKLRHFCGVAVSLTLALPLARFYTRSLYWDMSLSATRADQRETSHPRATGAGARNTRRGRTHTLQWPKLQLSRQSLRDLAYWRSLTRGEGRDLLPRPADLTMHSDAADVGYGGTLGTNPEAGSPGLWEGQGLWTTRERAEPITLRELKAVRMLLHRHFASFVARAETRKLLLHEDNQSVVRILNAMVSASRPMMAELRRLETMMRVLGVRIEARWLPSAINRYADSLSRQWDPGDLCVTEQLVQSLSDAYAADVVVFPHRPVGEHPIARRKYLAVQMQEDWGDGRARMWNPPFDMLPLVLKKMQIEGAQGVLVAPHWPAQPWFGLLRRLATRMRILDPDLSSRSLVGSRRINPAWELVVAEIASRTAGAPPYVGRC